MVRCWKVIPGNFCVMVGNFMLKNNKLALPEDFQ